MFIEEIDGNGEKRTLGDKFECFGKKLGKLVDLGYEILADKKLPEAEKNELADIIATISGAKKASYDLMAKHSEVSKEIRDKIDRKADEFAEMLTK